MRTPFLAGLLALTVLLGACGGGDDGSADASSAAAAPAPAAAAAEVTISTFSFGPDPLTVPAGTTVTWTNEDEILHTVTAEGGEFASDLDGAGTTFEHTFDEAGTFAYVCTVHPGPGMEAEVVVEPAP